MIEGLALLALFFGIVGWFAWRLKIGRDNKKEARESIKRKHYENLTEYEKFIALEDLNAAYNGGRGPLDYKSYDILVSKINGTKSTFELQMELAKIRNTTPKPSVGDVAMPKMTDAEKQKEATKTIVKDAVVGGIIAGPAGAVVGAIVGKNKVDNNKKE